MFNFNSRQLPLGLDISDISLKLMQFDRQQEKYVPEAYADVAIPLGALAGDKIADPKALVKAIRQAILSPTYGKVTTSYVVASIPETKSFIRVIQMQAVSETEAIEAIPWEAEAYIPLPVSQVYLDWVILDSSARSLNPQAEAAPGSPGESKAKMTVLITATPKDYVDAYVAVLKEAGLHPLALEAESQATARSLISRKDEAVLIADIDTVRTSLIISENGTLQFTSSLPTAGNVFTESISKALTVDLAEAEKVKREVGIGKEAKDARIKKALNPVLNNLVGEIKNTIRFYEEHAGEKGRISRLLLSGGSSKLKHLPSFLHDRLMHEQDQYPLRSLPGIKVELGNPWLNVLQKGQVPPISREDSLSYATAIGLALREEA